MTRRCANSGCETILRSTNKGSICSPCERTESSKQIDTLRKRSTREGRVEVILAVLAKGPTTERRLRYELNASHSTVGDDLLGLIAAGRVELAPKLGGVRHFRLAVNGEEAA